MYSVCHSKTSLEFNKHALVNLLILNAKSRVLIRLAVDNIDSNLSGYFPIDSKVDEIYESKILIRIRHREERWQG